MNSRILENINKKILMLEANKIDTNTDILKKSKSRVNQLSIMITVLNEIIEEESQNPNFVRIIDDCVNLKNDFIRINNAYQGIKIADSWLNAQNYVNLISEIYSKQNLIIKRLKEWYKIVKKRIEKVGNNNKHLRNIPVHKNGDFFYAKIIELNPERNVALHPLTSQQIKGQDHRTNKELILFNEQDPISGYRVFSKTDDIKYPGSVIHIVNGHHRLNELFKRYIQGRID